MYLSRAPEGVILFFGPEEYLKRHYLVRARRAILGEGGEGDPFSHIRIEDGDLGALGGQTMSLSLMATQKLIEFTGFDYERVTAAQTDELCDRLAESEDSLIILYAHPDELDAGAGYPKRASDKFKKLNAKLEGALGDRYKSVYFEMQTPARLGAWVQKHFSAEKIFVDRSICSYMIERCGTNMQVLANEVEKLCAYSKASGEAINERTVDLVCTQNRVYGAFDFVNALLKMDKAGAYTIYCDMRNKKIKSVEIMATISKTVAELCLVKSYMDSGVDAATIQKRLNLSEYPLKLRMEAVKKTGAAALAALRERTVEADMMIKSTNLNDYYVIEKLILS